MPTRKHVVIAGAGIGGLTAAIALAMLGHRVDVLEQAPMLMPVGAGVTLSPNAMRVYRYLGLEATLCAEGIEPDRQRIQHWQDGRILLSLARGNHMRETYGAPYLYIHRADLHAAMVARLAAFGDLVRVRLGAAVVGASGEGGRAAVMLQGDERVEGDVVIACDGIKSRLRELFAPGPAQFTGHVAWRAVVPVQGEVLEDLAGYPGMHIGPKRMVVRYPVKRGTHLNLVFFSRAAGWAADGWTARGDLADLAENFGDWSPEIAALRGAIDPAVLNKWGVFAHRPLAGWVKDGRIAVMGDAAHAMTPFMGQGAACAIEDAMVLARCLTAEDEVPAALRRYEAARIERCAFIQEESNANAERVQGDEAELYGVTNVRNEETLGLFDYDAVTVGI